MADAFIGNNMTQGSAGRSMTQMGWVLSDACIERRTMDDSRPQIGTLAGSTDVAGLWDIRPGQVLGRSLDTSDHLPKNNTDRSMIRGRNKVWVHTNGLHTQHAYGFAGIAATAHNGADPHLADQKVSIIQSGAATIASNIKEDADTGDVVIVDMPTYDTETKTYSSSFPGDPKGVAPLQLRLGTDNDSNRFDVANSISTRLVETLCISGESGNSMAERLNSDLDFLCSVFEKKIREILLNVHTKNVEHVYFHKYGVYSKPDLFRAIYEHKDADDCDGAVSLPTLPRECVKFAQHMEWSLVYRPTGGICSLYTLAQLAVNSIDDSQTRLRCSVILMHSCAQQTHRLARYQYHHVVGTVMSPAKAGEPIDVLIR